MNVKMVLKTVGKVLELEAVLLLIPVLTAVLYGETQAALGSLAAAAIAAAVGLCLWLVFRKDNNPIYAKEGFVTVSLCWIFVSVIGALPFVFSGEIPNFIDALFETVSGFTTTGATVLSTNEELAALGHGLLLWRSFTHFVGGMGVLVFVLAVTDKSSDRTMHLLRAEMPGPIVDKLVPKARDTALILYGIYLGLTLLLFIFLLFGGIGVFESAIYAFGTAGTGGFGIVADSLAGYSGYVKWVLAVFMMLFGVNFNLYFLLLLGRVGSALKSRELWCYLAIMLSATVLIALDLIGDYEDAGAIITDSFFQASSFMTTTGYTTANFDAYPALAKGVLLMLMFIGGSAGSTAGGLKVTRVMILCKKTVSDVKRMLHPRQTNVVMFEGKCLEKETVDGVAGYFVLYMFVIFATFLLLSLDPMVAESARLAGISPLETNFTAAVSCFNNIGPAFGLASGSYAVYSPFSRVVLTVAMLLGRLEIYPLIITLYFGTWLKRQA